MTKSDRKNRYNSTDVVSGTTMSYSHIVVHLSTPLPIIATWVLAICYGIYADNDWEDLRLLSSLQLEKKCLIIALLSREFLSFILLFRFKFNVCKSWPVTSSPPVFQWRHRSRSQTAGAPPAKWCRLRALIMGLAYMTSIPTFVTWYCLNCVSTVRTGFTQCWQIDS